MHFSDAGMPRLADPVSRTDFDLDMGAYQATGVSGLGSLCADSVRNVANELAANGGLDRDPGRRGDRADRCYPG